MTAQKGEGSEKGEARQEAGRHLRGTLGARKVGRGLCHARQRKLSQQTGSRWPFRRSSTDGTTRSFGFATADALAKAVSIASERLSCLASTGSSNQWGICQCGRPRGRRFSIFWCSPTRQARRHDPETAEAAGLRADGDRHRRARFERRSVPINRSARPLCSADGTQRAASDRCRALQRLRTLTSCPAERTRSECRQPVSS